jgi:hypothetical protein
MQTVSVAYSGPFLLIQQLANLGPLPGIVA